MMNIISDMSISVINVRGKIVLTGLLLITLLFLLTGLVSCGDGDGSSEDAWKYVGEMRDEHGKNVLVYIDLKNMQVDDKIRTFWIKYYAEKDDGEPEERYVRQKGLWEVDCQDRALYVLEEEYYSTDGELLGKNDKMKKEEYEEDSLGTKMTAAACRYAGRN